MDKITLSENHRRTISSSMYIIEKMLNDIEHAILHPDNGVMSKSIVDIVEKDLEHYLIEIKNIRKQLTYIAVKYDLRKEEVKLSRLINSRKAKMWETVHDTTSRKLKGYKDFPKDHIVEFDTDITRLRSIIEGL
jgi:hypothetical protein